MNRSAYCIQMLQLLKARGLMSKEELAKELHTNKRNLVEYRKELEAAGYRIESTTGPYGGYQLASGCYLPVLNLNEDEQRALSDAQNYLAVQPDFLSTNDFIHAMDKIKAQLHKVDSDNIYMHRGESLIDEKTRSWIRLCEQAIAHRQVVQLEYKGMKDTKPKTIQIHPYEILHYQAAYYCLAYSLSAKDYRNYKFSKERMKQVTLVNQFFTRDCDFDVKDHIGALGLIKGDLHEFEILIQGPQAILAAEQEIGLHPQMHWKDENTLYLKTIMEGKLNVISFLLSLGNQLEILSPLYLQEEIRTIVCEMYEKNMRSSKHMI